MEEKINQSIKTMLSGINEMVNVDSVIGKPICFEDSIVIPVSKVTLAEITGSGEYGKTGLFAKSKDMPYSAGNGSIVSLKPYCFLVKENNKSFKIINIEKDNLESIIDKSKDIIESIKENIK